MINTRPQWRKPIINKPIRSNPGVIRNHYNSNPSQPSQPIQNNPAQPIQNYYAQPTNNPISEQPIQTQQPMQQMQISQPFSQIFTSPQQTYKQPDYSLPGYTDPNFMSSGGTTFDWSRYGTWGSQYNK